MENRLLVNILLKKSTSDRGKAVDKVHTVIYATLEKWHFLPSM